MNIDKMTIKLRQGLSDADALANANGNAEISSEHLLAALLSQKEGVLIPLFERIGIPPATVLERTEKLIDRLPKAYGGAVKRSISASASSTFCT